MQDSTSETSDTNSYSSDSDEDLHSNRDEDLHPDEDIHSNTTENYIHVLEDFIKNINTMPQKNGQPTNKELLDAINNNNVETS